MIRLILMMMLLILKAAAILALISLFVAGIIYIIRRLKANHDAEKRRYREQCTRRKDGKRCSGRTDRKFVMRRDPTIRVAWWKNWLGRGYYSFLLAECDLQTCGKSVCIWYKAKWFPCWSLVWKFWQHPEELENVDSRLQRAGFDVPGQSWKMIKAKTDNPIIKIHVPYVICVTTCTKSSPPTEEHPDLVVEKPKLKAAKLPTWIF